MVTHQYILRNHSCWPLSCNCSGLHTVVVVMYQRFSVRKNSDKFHPREKQVRKKSDYCGRSVNEMGRIKTVLTWVDRQSSWLARFGWTSQCEQNKNFQDSILPRNSSVEEVWKKELFQNNFYSKDWKHQRTQLDAFFIANHHHARADVSISFVISRGSVLSLQGSWYPQSIPSFRGSIGNSLDEKEWWEIVELRICHIQGAGSGSPCYWVDEWQSIHGPRITVILLSCPCSSCSIC